MRLENTHRYLEQKQEYYKAKTKMTFKNAKRQDNLLRVGSNHQPSGLLLGDLITAERASQLRHGGPMDGDTTSSKVIYTFFFKPRTSSGLARCHTIWRTETKRQTTRGTLFALSMHGGPCDRNGMKATSVM